MRLCEIFVPKNEAISLVEFFNFFEMKRIVFAALVLFATNFFFSCKDSEKDIELEEITSRINSSDGWNDIFLKIVSDSVTDSSHIYIAKGLYNDEIVGLQFELNSEISAGIIEGRINGKGMKWNAVKLRTIGPQSDLLVKVLAKLYKEPVSTGFSKQTILANAYSLNEAPVDLNKSGYYKLKLFFEDNNEELYSELFLHINTEKKEIEMNEKDEIYRKPLIKVFTK